MNEFKSELVMYLVDDDADGDADAIVGLLILSTIPDLEPCTRPPPNTRYQIYLFLYCISIISKYRKGKRRKSSSRQSSWLS